MNQSQARPNPVWSFLVGLWRFVDFANHLFFNLIMGFLLLVFLVLLGAAFSAGSGNSGYGPLKEKTALVLDLEGTLVEQYTSAPIERAFAQASGNPQREIQLRDLTRAIAAAKDDKRIDRIVLLTDGFAVPGFAALRELGAALRDFRSGGKQVIAYGAGIEQKQYYLAAQADEVYLDPNGMVLLEGLGRYRLYYRQALQEKLGVDVHLFRVGEYKSAAEPYILDAASPESREADLFWMNDLWNRYLDDIASARKLSREQLVGFVAAMPERVQAAKGDIAQLALDNKLVDALKTPHQIEKLLSERGELDEERGSFRRFCELVGSRSVTEFNYRISDTQQAHVFVGMSISKPDEADKIARSFQRHRFATVNLTDDELAKEHVRHMVGGRSSLAEDERIYRFEFPERPGALMRFLSAMSPDWNISLFHYRNQGADYGRILVGLQVPAADHKAFDRFLASLGYPCIEETQNPVYRMFLQQ